MTRSMLALLLAAALGGPAAAQEKVTIKIKHDAKGDVVKATAKDGETSKMNFTSMGMTQAQNKDSNSTAVFTEKILEKEAGKRSTRLQRNYEKAEFNLDGRKIAPSFIGKDVIIERSGGKYKFSVGDSELTGDDAAALAEEFKDKERDKETNIDEILFPKNPVGVNETWKLDLDAVAKDFGEDAKMAFDIAKSSGSGKLTKLYTKNGKQFGVLQVELDLALTKVGEGAMSIQLDKGSKAKLTFHYDGCIDGTSNSGKLDAEMEMKMTGTLTVNGVEVKVDASMKKNESKTQEDMSR